MAQDRASPVPLWRNATLWGYVLAALATLLLLAWTRHFTVPWLVVAVLSAGAAALIGLRRSSATGGSMLWRTALGLLALSLVVGALTTQRFRRIEREWTAAEASVTLERRERLARRMDTVINRGRRAAQLASDASARGTQSFARLEAIRVSAAADAVVLLDATGGLVAWAGDHRGRLPEEVREGQVGVFFAERPLFSYLYFVAPASEPARTAVAAVLIDAALEELRDAEPPPGSVEDLTMRAGGASDPDWSLVEAGDTIAHALLEPITQATLRMDVERTTRRVCVVLGLAALILLGASWLRWSGASPARARTTIPILTLALGFAIAPLGTALGLDVLFAPSLFVLPLPGDISLGGLVAPVVALAALIATLRPPALTDPRYRWAVVAGAIAVAIGYPAALRVFIEASSPTLLEGGSTLWFGLQLAALLILAGLTALALPRMSRKAAPAHGHRLLLAGGAAVLSALALALLVVWRVDPERGGTPWTALLWVLPFVLLAVAFTRYGGRAGSLARWLAAGALAATVTLPHLWIAQTRARLDAASREVASLGSELPPIVEFLLVGFGSEVHAQYERGERGLQLLYRSWAASGLAGEPYGARITLWGPDGTVESEVALGGAEGTDADADVVRRLVADARTDTIHSITGVSGVPGISRVLTVPLGEGRVVSVSVPPRRNLERPSVLAPFLGTLPDPDVELTLVEAIGDERPNGEIVWQRAAGGFRSDVVVRFPDGIFHAHTRVGTTALSVLFARGVLLGSFDLLVLVLLWLGGNVARGLSPVPPGAMAALAASFRARVTVALFLFFLAPTALFGLIAYRAFAREVERAAETIGARAVSQVVQDFPLSDGNLRVLAQRADADVLYYYNSGELAQASSSEALGLGVHSAWLSPQVFLTLRTGEEPATRDVRRLGDEQYLMAYHVLRPAGILAVPTLLSSGETAVRQRELAHIVLFTALIGALLSFMLSLAVGRALAGPIGRLRRAAGAVGAGRLHVQLPELKGDEFGELYASFNRMVRRLRRARKRERESARVLAWGEMARQVAHEIKNPLTPIKLSVQHLRRAYRDRRPEFGDILEENTEQILGEIDRLTEIARAFSRYGAPEPDAPLEEIILPDVVREALTLYRSADEAIRYRAELQADLPRIMARRGEMKEVLLNLVENAREALAGAGTITVRARAVDGRVDLAIEDDGPGIPVELLARVFDPHFSTRSTGTGLGLAIVRRLVEGWGGVVAAESEPGKGTTVRMQLRTVDGERP